MIKSFPIMTVRIKLLTLVALVSGISTGAFAENWPQYRGPHGDGIVTSTVKLTAATKAKQLWKAPTPNGFSSFSVDGGKVFTVVSRDVDGKPAELCIALDAATGRELWATPTGVAKYPGGGESGAENNKGGDGPRSTPTVSGSHVYVYSCDMVLSCLDAATGKLVWSKDVIKEFAGKNISWKSAMSPVSDGSLLYLAGGGAGQAMLALKEGSGDVVWKTGDETMTHATPVVTTLGGVRQVVYLMESGLVAREAATGKALWQFPFQYRTSTACLPVFGGNLVLCTAGYDVGGAACEVTKSDNGFAATQVWRSKGNNPVASLWSPPVYKDGFVYGMISFKKFATGPLKCVDLKTGALKWEQPGFGAGNVILIGDKLVALTDAGEVVIVEATSDAYKEVTRFKAVDGKCWSYPAFADGKLYVRSTKEGACFELN